MGKNRVQVVINPALLAVVLLVLSTGVSIPQLLDPGSIGLAKLSSGYVFLTGKVVTTVLDDQGTQVIYIQEQAGSSSGYSGIRVIPAENVSVKPGDVVTVWGCREGGDFIPECRIALADVSVDGTGAIPSPVAVSGATAAGGAFGIQPALYRNTPDQAGFGLSTVGMRVKVYGKVTWTDGDKICFIDDGSNLGSVYMGVQHKGLRLVYQPKCRNAVDDFVVVTGVLGAEMSDDGCPVPVVRVEPKKHNVSVISDNLASYPDSKVPLYEKFELAFAIDNLGQPFVDFNPLNPNTSTLSSDYWDLKGIAVDTVLISPGGRAIEWPCFWYEGSDQWTGWKMRFTPTESGIWSYKLRISYGSDVFETESRSFECCQSGEKGFLSVCPQDSRYFEFSNGELFVPVGVDLMGWNGYDNLKLAAEDCFPRISANGGNFSRVLSTNTNIEKYDNSVKYLNKYSMSRALEIDGVLEAAKASGIYLEWCIDDWTWLKNNPDGTIANKNQYLKSYDPATGALQRDAPCATVADFFSSPTAQEIYKRKLRYWMARWGYSPNLMCIELINEVGGYSSLSDDWHQIMANFLHGDDNALPASWGSGDIQDLDAQPHLVSSSNGSSELRTTGGVPWNGIGNSSYDSISVDGTVISKPGMDCVNYHDYGRGSLYWSTLGSKCSYSLESLGCVLEKPWYDMSVWADRTGRVYCKNLAWTKPLCWTEFGLDYVDSLGWHDWEDAYNADVTARHFRDVIWPGAFNGVSVLHSKLNYMRGGGNYTAGGDKFWTLKPLTNFLAGENLRGLHHETAYPGVITPDRLECSNPNILAMVMAGSDRAYIYVKNLTDVWYRVVDQFASGLPVPSDQSGVIKVYGLTPGSYTLEKWSTFATDQSAQVVSSQTATVPASGTLELSVTVGCGLVSGYDWAYKLKFDR
ncbi:MAG: hypothetical protein ABFD64_01770 [Armatimonadota bacterium]